ncbi:uncharacterized protein [Dysidea avara]|uniref:uncharacterized protein isoform X2 n=1 Tax=Dysidea avara TaxID=196820 RepID=UPI003322EF06
MEDMSNVKSKLPRGRPRRAPTKVNNGLQGEGVTAKRPTVIKRLSDGASPRRSLLSVRQKGTDSAKRTRGRKKEKVQQFEKHKAEDTVKVNEEQRTDETGEESKQQNVAEVYKLCDGVSPRRSLLSVRQKGTDGAKRTTRRRKEVQQMEKHQVEDTVQIKEEQRTDETGEEIMQQEQQGSQLMATLVEDLAMSDSDDGGNETVTTEVVGMQVPDSKTQQQFLILPKPSCARCIIFNSAASTKRRQRHVIQLLLSKRNDITDHMIPEIVIPTKKQTKSLQKYLLRLEKNDRKAPAVVRAKVDMEPAECSHIPQPHVIPSKHISEESMSILNTSAEGIPEFSAGSILEVAESSKIIKTEVVPAECSHVPHHHPSSGEQVAEGNVTAPAEDTAEINADSITKVVESAKVKTEEVDMESAECSHIPQHHVISSNSGEHPMNVPVEDTTETSTDNIIEEALRVTMMDFSADQNTDNLNNTKSSVQVTSPAVCRVPPRTRRRRNVSPEPVKKKSCVVDLRSIKKPSASENDRNLFIRIGKINLSKLKTSKLSENDESLREIVRQKNLSISLVKLTTAELPANCHWPSTKPSAYQLSSNSVGRNEDNFTFNLDKVVSNAAKQFSFSVAPTETADKGSQVTRKETVFERLGELVNPFIANLPIKGPKTPPVDLTITPPTEDPTSPIKPRTPSSLPRSDIQEEDILEIHPMEDFIDEVTSDVLVPCKPVVSKIPAPNMPTVQTPTVQTTAVQRTVRITPVQRATIPTQQMALSQQPPAVHCSMRAVSKQRSAPVRDSTPAQQWMDTMPPPMQQFDKPVPQPYKHEQVCQWVHNTWSNPPPPPPGYLTPSEGSGAVIFSFPSNSSPIPTPATTPPHGLEEDFDSISVQQNGISNDRKPAPWPPRRDSHTPNGFKSYSEPPKGLCFKYWKTGSCSQKRGCKFLHVRNPERFWNCEGFFPELEQLILHNVETAWNYIKSSPPVPVNTLEVVIQTCVKQASSPHVVQSNMIHIAEGAFNKMLVLPLCRRESFVLMLKLYASNHCNTQAFWVVQEMTRKGFLLSKEMASTLITCYHPSVNRLCDLIMWLDKAGLFKSLFNRLPQCIAMETQEQEICNYLELCAHHQVKIHHSNTQTLVNFFMAHTNCGGVIRVLELSHDPSVISPDQMEFFMLNHQLEQLDRVTNILVGLFPSDLCVAVSTAAWNNVLAKCCVQQRSAKAMQIFQFMSNCSKVINKEVYLSLMTLHCNQRHPGEALTVLEHQIRHHGDISSVSKVCQMLLKHRCWETVGDVVMCVINAGHKVEKSTMKEIKTNLLQNNEAQRWNSLLEKACDVGIELDPPDTDSFLFADAAADTTVTQFSAPPPTATQFSVPPPTATQFSAPPPVCLQNAAPTFCSPVTPTVEFPPPPSIAPQTTTAMLPLQQGLYLDIVKRSILDGQWLVLGGVLQMAPVNLALIQTISSAIQNYSNIHTAFGALINGLKKFHQANDNQPPEGELTVQEQNLIGQVGVLMIMNAVSAKQWQRGFHVLYLLHQHGIHYVNDQGGWSPCLIAVAAVECCLQLDIPPSALEVMRGAQWVSSSDPIEKEKRDNVLEKLVRACLAKNEIVGAQETLQALGNAPNSIELHQQVLRAAKDAGNLDVFNKLSNKDQPPSLPSASKPILSPPIVEKRVHFSSPTTTAAVSSSTTTKIEQVKSKRDMKIEFRQKVAEIYCQRLKYYYHIKKITSNDDYTHLAKTLYKSYCQKVESQSSGPWEVTPEMAQEMHKSVDNMFAKFTVYSKDLDATTLNLT